MQFRAVLRRSAIRALLFAGAASVGAAHRVDLSAAHGRLVGDTFTFSIQLAASDVPLLPAPAARALEHEHFAEARPYLLAFASAGWEVRTDGVVAPPVNIEVDRSPAHGLVFRLSFLRLGARTISLRARHLAAGRADQREFVTIAGAGGSAGIDKVLTRDDDSLEFQVSPLGELVTANAARANAPAPHRSAWSFVRLGVEHIWTGYDHLLFLLGLLVVCRRFRSIVSIVSCFTVAHSITLAVATLGWIRLSPAVTEPAIAATIVFVSVENLVRRGREPAHRGLVTFAFGLIHGFGFATALRDLGVGANGTSLAVPLFAFNVGVEIGQIIIAAAVLPLLWHWRKNETFVRVGVPALSALGAAAGLFWFIQRTVYA